MQAAGGLHVTLAGRDETERVEREGLTPSVPERTERDHALVEVRPRRVVIALPLEDVGHVHEAEGTAVPISELTDDDDRLLVETHVPARSRPAAGPRWRRC